MVVDGVAGSDAEFQSWPIEPMLASAMLGPSTLNRGDLVGSRLMRTQRLLIAILTIPVVALVLWLALDQPQPTPPAVVPGVSGRSSDREDSRATERESTAGAEHPASWSVSSHDDSATAADGDMPADERSPLQTSERSSPLVDTFAAMLAGSVVDARTGEPLPGLKILARAGEGRTRGKTSEDGTILMNGLSSLGSLIVEIRDAGALVDTLNVQHQADTPLALKVAIGPTYPILLESDDGELGTWKARIVETRQAGGSGGRIEVLEHGLRVRANGRSDPDAQDAIDVHHDNTEGPIYGTDIGDRKWPWVHIRRGNPPWIRYPSPEWEPIPGYTAHLEVLHSSASWRGIAPLSSTVGLQPAVRVLAEPTDPRGVLEGKVVDSSGRAVRARVILLPTEEERGSEDRPPFFAEQSTDPQARFRIEGIPVGWRDMIVYAPDHPIERQRVNIRPGIQFLADIVLPRRQHQHEIEVRFRATEPMTGRYMCRLRLSAAGPYARAWLESDGYRSGDERDRSVGSFDLPAAEFEYLGIGAGMPPRWTPAQLTLQAQPLRNFDEEVRRLEEVPPEDRDSLGFDVTDGDAALPEFRVYFGPGGAMELDAKGRQEMRWNVAPGTPLSWTVWAEGFAPVCGTEAAFKDRDGEHVASVKLQEGWGALLYFRVGSPRDFKADPGPWRRWIFPNATDYVGAWGAPPLPNVRIHMDGKAVAQSDEEGRALIVLPDRPMDLLIVSPGWRISGLEPVPGRGRDDLPWRHIVWMVRE